MWRAFALAVLCLLPLAGATTSDQQATQRKPNLSKLSLCFGYGLHAYRRALGEAVDGQASSNNGEVTETAKFKLDGNEIEVELHNRFYDFVTIRFPKGKYKAWGEAALAIGLSTQKTTSREMVGGALRVTGFSDSNVGLTWTPVGADFEPENLRGDEEVEVNKGPWDEMKVTIVHDVH